jgi:type IV fimbrial biogenesis protein FimT
MRQLMRRGLTLIELVVAMAIGAILMSMAAPSLSDFWLNHQLRAAGDTVLGEALYARTEAIKRNVPTRLVISGADLTVRDMGNGAGGVLIRQRRLADGMSATGSAQVDFDSRGIVLPLGTEAAIDIGKSGLTCSADFRCPGLRVDGGGNMRLCADKLACT